MDNRIMGVAIRDLKDSERTILDVGCGACRVAHMLRSAGKRAISIDISLETLRAAKSHNPDPVVNADNMQLPYNGMGMGEVESGFGTPDTKQAAIGDPPISRWVYDRWSVFFEYDSVLYTVLHKGEVIKDRPAPEAESETEPE